MSEEAERMDTGAVASAAGADPTAMSFALGAAAQNERVAAEAEAFLRDQRELITDQRKLVQLQAKELAHELKLRHWSLQLRHASAILKFALEVSAAAVGVAIVCFLAAVVWNAAHADGLVIESFSVPPEMAARGLTGQVVATQMLDKLNGMQNDSSSIRAAKSYANNWGNNIEVQIPD